MRYISIFVLLVSLLTMLSACQTSDLSDVSTIEQQVPVDTVLTGNIPIRISPINVQTDFIAPHGLEPQAISVAEGNLYDNGGFENGLTGWTGCSTGAIVSSSDALEGSGALQVNPANCFYRSVTASAGQELTLTCNVKVLSGTAWTGMGLNFTDSNFTTISSTPTTVATSNSYTAISTNGTAPAGTQSASMWLYSDNPAVVDNCSLVASTTPPPPSGGNNILENSGFETSNGAGGTASWSAGCAGTVSRTGAGDINLLLQNGACVDQGLSSNDISALDGSNYSFSCNVFKNTGYAALTLFIDGRPASKVIPVDTSTTSAVSGVRVAITGTVQNFATSGFVSVYADGQLTIDDCRLEIDGDIPPPPPPPPPPTNDNLIENPAFGIVDANDKPVDWSKGCSGEYSTSGISPGRKSLVLENGACVDQALSAPEIAALAGKQYTFSCDPELVRGYAALTVFFNGQPTSKVIPTTTSGVRVELTATAPDNITSGFVSIYADDFLRIDDCILTINDLTNPPEGSDNLLENGKFAEFNTTTGEVTEWIGCGGTVTRINAPGAAGGTYLTLSNAGCLYQNLSSSEVSSLAGKQYSYSCTARRSIDYSSLSINFGGSNPTEVVAIPLSNSISRVTLTGTAPSSLSSVSVGIYGENQLDIDDCVLKILN